MGQIVCPRCGQPNADTANACGHCGCFLKPYPMNNISPEAQNYPPQGTSVQNPPAEKKVYSDFFSLWKSSRNVRASKAMKIVSIVLIVVACLCFLPTVIYYWGRMQNPILATIVSILLFLVPIFLSISSIFMAIMGHLQVLNCSAWMHRVNIAPDFYSLKHANGTSKAIAYYYFMPKMRGYRIFLTVWDSIVRFIGLMLTVGPVAGFFAINVWGLSIADLPMGNTILLIFGVIFAVGYMILMLGMIPTFVEKGLVNSYINKKPQVAEEAAQKNSAQPDAEQQNATQPDAAWQNVTQPDAEQPNTTQKNTPTD